MTRILLSKEFSETYERMKTRSTAKDGDAEYLLGIIDKGIHKIERSKTTGQKIVKRQWPKYYVRKYGVTNLWRVRLDNYWRLIYTIVGDHVEIVVVVLELMGHKDYDKRFGYS